MLVSVSGSERASEGEHESKENKINLIMVDLRKFFYCFDLSSGSMVIAMLCLLHSNDNSISPRPTIYSKLLKCQHDRVLMVQTSSVLPSFVTDLLKDL